MKAYEWSIYSKQYCEEIKILDSSEDNTFCIYEAFNKAEWNRQWFIVYKDKVVIESFNYNEMVHKFYGMLDLFKHLKEEGELK